MRKCCGSNIRDEQVHDSVSSPKKVNELRGDRATGSTPGERGEATRPETRPRCPLREASLTDSNINRALEKQLEPSNLELEEI